MSQRTFLDASTHHHKRVCLSVHWSGRPSVRHAFLDASTHLYEGLSVSSVRHAFFSNWSKVFRIVPRCPQMSLNVPGCPKMSQNAHKRRIVVRMDLLSAKTSLSEVQLQIILIGRKSRISLILLPYCQLSHRVHRPISAALRGQVSARPDHR